MDEQRPSEAGPSRLRDPSEAERAAHEEATVFKTRRNPVACRRCRRSKIRCSHSGNPPCVTCVEVGADCQFPEKGTRNIDRVSRGIRAPRLSRGVSETTTEHQQLLPRASSQSPLANAGAQYESEGSVNTAVPPLPVAAPQHPSNPSTPTLPPPETIADVIAAYHHRFLQAGMLHTSFVVRARQDPGAVEPCLLWVMCALAVPFVPALVRDFAGQQEAAEWYANQARTLVMERLAGPNVLVATCCYLLALLDWGRALNADRSYLYTGLAARICNVLGLHLRETYATTPPMTPEQAIDVESTRRILWWILISDRLFCSSSNRPPNISVEDVTAPLPASEADFAFGSLDPTKELFIQDLLDPERPLPLAGLPLLATTCTAAELWGRSARRACSTEPLTEPWLGTSQYQSLNKVLAHWHRGLSPQQRYSRLNLSGHIAGATERVFVLTHALYLGAHLLLRRPHLASIATHLNVDSNAWGMFALVNSGSEPAPPPGWWSTCSSELFGTATDLVTMILDYSDVLGGEGGELELTPFIGLVTFLAAKTLTYVERWNSRALAPFFDVAARVTLTSLGYAVSPQHAPNAASLITRAKRVLLAMRAVWPLVDTYIAGLSSEALQQGSPQDAARNEVASYRRSGIYRVEPPQTSSNSTAPTPQAQAEPSPAPILVDFDTTAPTSHEPFSFNIFGDGQDTSFQSWGGIDMPFEALFSVFSAPFPGANSPFSSGL